MDKHQEENDENNVNVPEINKQKQVLFTEITGKVKWFNVKLGYGFVCRNDNHEDIFIHQSAIVKSNPEHQRKSVEDGEEILFDIVQGNKGNEAFNVSGLNGNCVKGSEYALRYQRGRGRGRGRGRISLRSSSGTHPDTVEGGTRTKEFVRGGKGVRGGGGGGKPKVQNQSKPKTEQEIKLPQNEKPMLCAKVTGKVKWFNVKRGYGFVCRNDNQQDIFIHQSAIVKNNPDHPRKSVKDGEEILFDVVKGDKGDEAANVSAADGSCVKGSDYALRYPRFRSNSRGRDRGRGMGRGQPRSREISEHEEFRNGPGGEFDMRRGRPMMMRRPLRGGRLMYRGGRPFNHFMGSDYQYYDMGPPPREYMYEMDDYYDMQMRGRGGGMRYNGPRPPPRDTGQMRFEEGGPGSYMRRPMGNRGRPRSGRPWAVGRQRARRFDGSRPTGEGPDDEQRDSEPVQNN